MTLSLRPFRYPEDVLSLQRCILASDEYDHTHLATTQAALDYDTGATDSRNLIVADNEGDVVGFVLQSVRNYGEYQRAITTGSVHPAWRRRRIGETLMHRAEQRALELRSTPRMTIELSARAEIEGMGRLAVHLGMAPVRWFYWMTRENLSAIPLPSLPAGIHLRTYVAGQDEEALLATSNEAFAQHWGTLPHDMGWLLGRQNTPGWRAESTVVAEDEHGRMVGFCTNALPDPYGHLAHGSTPVVDRLGVRPEQRGRGLGHALLLTALQRIRAGGFDRAMLHVDADNSTGAVALYESIGFRVTSRITVYRKEIFPQPG